MYWEWGRGLWGRPTVESSLRRALLLESLGVAPFLCLCWAGPSREAAAWPKVVGCSGVHFLRKGSGLTPRPMSVSPLRQRPTAPLQRQKREAHRLRSTPTPGPRPAELRS
ncbi:hypothetical protein NDU88_007862 [Pleurodeles waltl]|uniref:Secreted protein n=1 Tax=Pleurodeles waltl TaxID=8319 RepID=A0AAV7PNS8_PLEWA|nr:hypothetical protein NDU88_007862 [Pleurodeles waltl]